MTWWQAFLLGLIQGVTEFLPVSSSGHLVLAQAAFGLNEPTLVFDVLLHVATLGAILVYFRKRVMAFNTQDLGLLVVGTIPIVLVGLFLKSDIEALFDWPLLVAMALIVTGLINVKIHQLIKNDLAQSKPSYAQIIVTGLFQALAVVPGISRSGSTLFGGLRSGLDKKTAFEWSFLLGIPAILGAAVLQLGALWLAGNPGAINWMNVGIGMVAAFVTGLLSLGLLEWVLKQTQFVWFGVYTWLAAVAFLLILPVLGPVDPESLPNQSVAARTQQVRPATALFDDPQYIVVNNADFYFADWTADEATWQSQVKPELIATIEEIETELGPDSDQRRVAWSTLLEYTDFPLDQPSDQSPYIQRIDRILELAEATNVPVYVPLNGFQWWNELPELWNHWDYDGNQTPGCANDEYELIIGYEDSEPLYGCNFPKLRDPAFRERFIAGYNPDNKWNVEWQDWSTPMQLNWRNWGAGGFRLAPPPNLVAHTRSKLTYRQVQTERYEAIIARIAARWQQWQAEGRSDLFAGLSIGTEVSLNASVTPEDEFEPYGYRGIQDVACPYDQPTCGAIQDFTPEQVSEYRQQVVATYLEDLARVAVRHGLPKQKVYTHVWSEAEVGQPRYENYLAAAFNHYSRPGLSLYGQSEDPSQFQLLQSFLAENEHPAWAAPEYSAHGKNWDLALPNTLADPVAPAQLIDVYNWREHKDTLMPGAVRRFLADEVFEPACVVSEVVPSTPMAVNKPEQLQWELLTSTDQATTQNLLVFANHPGRPDTEPDLRVSVATESTSVALPELSAGVYYWQVERRGCQPALRRTSVPRTLTIPHQVAEPSRAMDLLLEGLDTVSSLLDDQPK